ncbi:peptidoglycan-binding domain-containing protein [Tropicimonas isoalkanivorans]|uniref:Putative peptidoglycan binding domain-containing protein n=1 Tax=Tropicimonas isoalkanivorans TaxID=441112 RepID=A0A1I1KRR9_9RHOB|nr:peptidoglycan-binding domain-containing protein [Tropicimonas isoalkanivorans]SFC63497.1 Putative peptidoglycan binding domain-containing protein [Tropicimonas isoalkanivorans]
MKQLAFVMALGGCALAAIPALADRALVIGAPEEQRRGLLRSAPMEDTAEALRNAGFEVITADAASIGEMRSALSDFMDGLSEEERAVVHLSGRFVRGDGRNWLLVRDLEQLPNLATVDDVGLSVETVLAIAGHLQGRSVVAIGQESGDGTPGEGLDAGLGLETIPQGVTVVRGGGAEIAAFVAGPLLEEGRNLPESIAQANNVTGQGFLSEIVAFLPEGQERPTAQPNEAEVERALWQATQAQDSVDAYEAYLDRYPEGYFADEAKASIDRIQNEPNREARMAEEALGLDRTARRQIQENLALLGHAPGTPDGVFGPASRSAITRFQGANGFPSNGYLTRPQIDRIALQADKRQAENEAEARRQQLAQEKADRETWAALGEGSDEAGLRTYLERYPDGLFAPIANERLDRIEAEAKAADAELERRDWEQARKADTETAYRAYLSTHPNGANADAAKTRIAKLSEPQQDKASDAPDAPDKATRKAAREVEAELGLTDMSRTLVERRLQQLGYEPGPVDGTFDRETRAAIRKFQSDRGMEVTGFMDQQTAIGMVSAIGGVLGNITQ